MKIHAALKEKNKLAGKLKQIDARIQKSGNWVRGNKPPYKIQDEMAMRLVTAAELNKLKAAISKATQPILPKILEMSELKSYVSVIKVVDLSDGRVHDRYSQNSDVSYDAAMSAQDMDNIVANWENKIASLQDEIDAYNAVTDVTL